MQNIYIAEDVAKLCDYVSKASYSQLFLLADEHTEKFCYPAIHFHLHPHHLIVVESGELNKTLQACEKIWDELTRSNADRNSLLINLGGGVIGDMGGFAAGCYKRGIRFVNVPTTLLAMVDASVGGKTGVDFQRYKNQIGLFSEPEAVFIVTDFLQTLSQREMVAGFAEVLKHYLIADKGAFHVVVQNLPAVRAFDWREVVNLNVTIKSSFVQSDPTEKNIRKALNFGHTVGHAIESFFLESESYSLLHGEAVAVGILCESYISYEQQYITETELKNITEVIMHYFTLPVVSPNDYQVLNQLVMQDKKNVDGKTQFTLLNGIGNYRINCAVSNETINASFDYYNKLLL